MAKVKPGEKMLRKILSIAEETALINEAFLRVADTLHLPVLQKRDQRPQSVSNRS